VVMSDVKAASLGITRWADRVVGCVRLVAGDQWGWAGFGVTAGPVPAGLAISDIDLVEINEAFAAQVIPVLPRPRHRPG